MEGNPTKAPRLLLRDHSAGQGLLLTTIALLGLGVVMVHSAVASVAAPGAWYARVDYRHTAFAVLGVFVLLTAWRLPYQWLARGRRIPILAAALLVVSLACGVLVFVDGIGYSVGGCRRWIRIGPSRYTIGFQPSELIKLALLIFLSAWLTRQGRNVRSFTRTFLPALGVIGVCAGLVITQDFGTAMLIGICSGAVLFLAGVPWYSLLLLVAGAAAGFYRFVVQDPRRWARILALLDPWSPTNPAAYQPRQSILAILSGGWFGKGPGNGIRKLGYLPEDSTDFIFSVYCEEWGFVGAMLLMSLLLLWIWNARRAAVRCEDRFGAVLAGSLGVLIAVQAVLHVAVDLVVAPPTGMGFPFVSAGGTSLVIMAAATALIVSVANRAQSRRAPATAGLLSADAV